MLVSLVAIDPVLEAQARRSVRLQCRQRHVAQHAARRCRPASIHASGGGHNNPSPADRRPPRRRRPAISRQCRPAGCLLAPFTGAGNVHRPLEKSGRPATCGANIANKAAPCRPVPPRQAARELAPDKCRRRIVQLQQYGTDRAHGRSPRCRYRCAGSRTPA